MNVGENQIVVYQPNEIVRLGHGVCSSTIGQYRCVINDVHSLTVLGGEM